MAAVGLTTVVFNLASDLSQLLVLEFVAQINPQPQTPGEDRMYGAGRYRALSAGATQRQWALAATTVEPPDLATLFAWDGLLLCYRDDLGTKAYGTYRSPAVTRHSYDQNSDVALTFTELTYSEAT